MNKLIFVSIVAFLLAFNPAERANATDLPLMGGRLNINLLINATTVSLKDSADSIYLGTLKTESRLGFGGEAALFYPAAPAIKAGPHFIFNYSPLTSSWHDFQLFQTSLGGIVDFDLGGGSGVSAFLDYNLGWFSAQQEVSSVIGTPAPAGNFAGGIPGYMAGVKAHYQIHQLAKIDLYYQTGLLMALTGVKYKNSSNQNAWMDAGISFSQAGVTVYF